jgi:hypothetical protein
MRLDRIILTAGLLSAMVGCGQKKLLTEGEKRVCKTISFDEGIAESIKQQTNASIELIPAISEYGEVLETKGTGLCSVIANEENGFDFVLREKENFRAKGYLLFLFEDDKNIKYLGTIKGQDELDIIRWRQTNGINYDHENKDIVAKLQTWKAKNDFIVLGASMDWLQFQFKTMPGDINSFAKEVYEFCPDIIDQGAGDMPTLIKEINRMQGLYLWWD